MLNEEVLRELNRYAGTPEGREFMRAALQRIEAQRSVGAALATHGVPADFAAVPIVESGYRNLDASRNSTAAPASGSSSPKPRAISGCAWKGSWINAWIPRRKARPRRACCARSSALCGLAARPLAFNMGSRGLQDAIDARGSRDAWSLIRAGAEGDPGYLARVCGGTRRRHPQAVAP